jgi:Holliday junction resolvasome RuvABC endonuclease subunit
VSVLALDLGTNMGWAILRADDRVESGALNIAPGTAQGRGSRFIKLYNWLLGVKRNHPELDFIAFEDVIFIGQRVDEKTGKSENHTTQPLILYGGHLATVLLFAELQRIRVEGFAVGTIKKQFTGSGKAKKVDVIKQCQLLGFRPQSEDEADAIAILHVATKRCPVLTMSGATKKATRADAKAAIAAAAPINTGTMPEKPF